MKLEVRILGIADISDLIANYLQLLGQELVNFYLPDLNIATRANF